MPLFNRILVPLDGSEHSLRALEIAAEIAKNFDSQLTLIHVYSRTPVVNVSPFLMKDSIALAQETAATVVEAKRKTGSEILAEGEKRGDAKGIQTEKLLREGHTIEEILKTVKTGEFSLIVMGARGLSRIREILLGSVSDGATRHAPCPVLVIKQQAPKE
ncbi:universal stress protein [Candidatus Bathyarchaeota archaeon]|nr:universal stress protein [Candidatus Bathyarchaeota archaeon]